MKKILIILGLGFGGFLIYRNIKKAKSIALDVSRLLFSIGGVGVPKFSKGFLSLPITITALNNTAQAFALPKINLSFYTLLHLVKKDGTRESLFSGTPAIPPVTLTPGQTVDLPLQLTAALPSLITSLLSLPAIQSLSLTITPRVLDQELPPITQEIPINPNLFIG